MQGEDVTGQVDSSFFKRKRAITLREVAEIAGAKLLSDAADFLINGIATLEHATNGDISFLHIAKYKKFFLATRAGACFINSLDLADVAPRSTALLLTDSPYKSFGLIAEALYCPNLAADITSGIDIASTISECALIHPTATIGKNCSIGPGVLIGEGVTIGDNCTILANSVIGHHVVIGSDSLIMSNVSIEYAVIGRQAYIKSGARIGQKGFGFSIETSEYTLVPQLGRVIVGDAVEIGANTTIDRGSLKDTIIGSGTKIDNQVQIAHNVSIGKACVIAGGVGIAGSAIIEDFCMIGGNSGIVGHIRLGQKARVAAMSGVANDIDPGITVAGIPAVPIEIWRRSVSKAMLEAKKRVSSKET